MVHRGANLNHRLVKLDQELLAVTGSTVSDEAMQKFESSMTKLRRLDVADGYFRLLKEVDELRCVEDPGILAEHSIGL